MNSCDILIENMLKFKVNQTYSIRNMLVAVLPYVASITKDNISKEYINFFTDTIKTINDGSDNEGEEDEEVEDDDLIR